MLFYNIFFDKKLYHHLWVMILLIASSEGIGRFLSSAAFLKHAIIYPIESHNVPFQSKIIAQYFIIMPPIFFIRYISLQLSVEYTKMILNILLLSPCDLVGLFLIDLQSPDTFFHNQVQRKLH
jgi:hypothetical protein